MILLLKVQVDQTGPVLILRRRNAWALLKLKPANDSRRQHPICCAAGVAHQ